MLQSFYEERDRPPSPAAAANGYDGHSKELLDSLQSGDDADAAAASADPRHASVYVNCSLMDSHGCAQLLA